MQMRSGNSRNKLLLLHHLDLINHLWSPYAPVSPIRFCVSELNNTRAKQ